MDALTVAAASGMKARLESLDRLANNLANQTSAGDKADRESYGLYASAEALDGSGLVPGPPESPVVERHWTDYLQGALARSDGPLDIALRGPGFFSVNGPGGVLYTRNGSFRLSATGQVETAEGYPVLDSNGRPITLARGTPVSIDEQGVIRQQGRDPVRLGITDVADPAALAKRSGTYFEPGGATARPFAGRVMQGYLEQSNGSPSESAVRLVTLLRQFEMLQKAVQINSEMGRRADDIAKTGQ